MDENQNPNQGQQPPQPSQPPEPSPAGGSCATCGKATSGYKCDMCGAESADYDPNHACGGEHCVAKCSGCGQAENRCICPPASPGAGPVPSAGSQPAPGAPAV